MGAGDPAAGQLFFLILHNRQYSIVQQHYPNMQLDKLFRNTVVSHAILSGLEKDIDRFNFLLFSESSQGPRIEEREAFDVKLGVPPQSKQYLSI